MVYDIIHPVEAALARVNEMEVMMIFIVLKFSTFPKKETSTKAVAHKKIPKTVTGFRGNLFNKNPNKGIPINKPLKKLAPRMVAKVAFVSELEIKTVVYGE